MIMIISIFIDFFAAKKKKIMKIRRISVDFLKLTFFKNCIYLLKIISYLFYFLNTPIIFVIKT